MKNHRALLVVATPTSRTLGGLFDVSASRNRQQRVWELQLGRCVGKPRWHARHHLAGRNVAGHDRPRPDERAGADRDAAENNRSRADCRIVLDADPQQRPVLPALEVTAFGRRLRKLVVHEEDAVTDQHAVADLDAVADERVALDLAPGADDRTALD